MFKIDTMKTILLNALFLTTLSTSANVKRPVKWPFLDLLAFNKVQHVELIVHHGRILGHVVVERGGLEEDNNGGWLLGPSGQTETIPVVDKLALAHQLLDRLFALQAAIPAKS